MGAFLQHGLENWPQEPREGRGRKERLPAHHPRSFWATVAFLGFLAACVTLVWLRPASDLVRELRLCRRIALLDKGRAWETAWAKIVRRSERMLTPEQAIRLLYPNYAPRLAPALRFRPPPAPHNIDVIRAATSRSLREITLRIYNENGETLRTSCRFLRLDGRTQWLDPADRSQLLFAAAFGEFDAGADACCIYRDYRVR